MEGATFAEGEFKGEVVDLAPAGGGVAVEQAVPGEVGEDDAVALGVVVWVDVGHGIAPSDTQCVGGFLRQRRGGEAE